MLGYSIQAFFGMRMCITAPFFWLFWGLLLASMRSVSGTEDGEAAAGSEKEPQKTG